MNFVFYGLIALAILFSGLQGAPEAEGQVQAGQLVVAAPAGVAAGTEVEVVGPSGMLRLTVEKVDAGKASLPSELPDGPVQVHFPAQHPIAAVGKASLDAAKSSVELAISLIGAMTLFLGLMKVVEAAGGLDFVARALRPVMVRLFPEVPPDHPAMGAMIMNLAANVLGLGNAATPFGIKAMQELERLNPHPGTATNAMVLFLAINTSGVAVLPTGVMVVRASLKSMDPAAIFVPTLLATFTATVAAVIMARLFQPLFRAPSATRDVESSPPPVAVALQDWLPTLALFGGLATLVTVVFQLRDKASIWILPLLILGMLTVGVVRRVRVYEVFIQGAKDGFESATRIIPFLVAILVAVAMFRASGAMDLVTGGLAGVCAMVGMPPEVLPMALLRSLSGSGAYAFSTELMKTHGPDSLVGTIAGTMQGSSETTFYVLSVYFGAVGVSKARHAVVVGVLSDVIAMLGAVWFVRWVVFS